MYNLIKKVGTIMLETAIIWVPMLGVVITNTIIKLLGV